MKKVITLMFVIGLAALTALGQSNTGRLVGSVSDASGVIPGATVVVTDQKTGRERTVVTSGDGTFSVPQLDAGSYTVKITAQGHKTFTASDVKIDVGRDYPLASLLEVGSIAENVTVVTGGEVINTANGELSNTISTRQIQDLPLNGRNPLTLIGLQAGVASNGAQTTTIDGQRATFTNITRDGINIQDNFIRGNAVDFTPDRATTDDIAEFTITTQNGSAANAYGASQVQEVTPRGQNSFHGGAWWYNRNSALAANTFTRNRTGVAKDPLNQNQIGGKISGPVLKNKLFFFGYYEAFRRRTTSTQNRTILLPDARNGIFTYLDNAGVRRQVNLFTALGGSTGITAVNPAIQSRFFATTPSAANNTSIGDQLNTSGYTFAQQGNQNRDGVVTRIDYELNNKNQINGVYSYKKDNNLRPDAATNFDQVPDVVQPNPSQFVALAWRWTPSATLTNEVRGGFHSEHPLFLNTSNVPASFVTPLLITTPEEVFLDQGRYSINYNLQDNAEYVRGSHSLSFGGLVQHFRVEPFVRFGTVPTYTIGTNVNTPQITTAQFTNTALFPGGISTGQRTTANSLLALVGGIVNGGAQTFNVASQTSGYVPNQEQLNRFAFENYALYLSDQWKARPNLTLNFGVRYDLYTPIRELQGLLIEPKITNGQDPTAAILDPNGTFQFIGGNTGKKNTFWKTDWNNFAPVLSFAYRPKFEGKVLKSLFGAESVLRGGYKLSYANDDIVVGDASNAVGLNVGLSTAVNAINPATGTTALNARADALPGITAPAFGAFPRPYTAFNTAAFAFFNTAFGVDPHLKTPMVQQYNFGYQRRIGFRSVIEVRYVGASSNNLPRALDYNQLEIRSNGFLADFNRARANLLLTGNPACTTAQNAGCQALTVFPLLPSGGLLNNATIQGQLIGGTPADLVQIYIQNNLAGTAVPFRANSVVGGGDLVQNIGILRYNSLQAEFRRDFANGLFFQANYTFQKTLGNAFGTANAANNNQSRFEPNLDNANPGLEYTRADYDATQVFNFNGIYELPFGKDKRWFNQGGWVDRVIGGFELTSIVNVATGAPISITDRRGTLNRANRSNRETALSSLSVNQIKNLVGVFKTPCGAYFINPSVININQANLQAGLCTQLGTGRAAEGFGSTPFAGQVFFNNAPGGTGALPRAFLNGPLFMNWDVGILKNIKVTEKVRFQIRAEAFNVLNRANFIFSSTQQLSAFDINSTNFGKITTVGSPRIMQVAGRLTF